MRRLIIKITLLGSIILSSNFTYLHALTINGSVKSEVQQSSLKSGVLFKIEAKTDSIESGNTANFNMILSVSGSSTSYQNAKVTIHLAENSRFAQNIDELVILGIPPVYDANNHTLNYLFETLNAGVSDKIIIKLDTVNGLLSNGETIDIYATFSADNLKDDEGNSLVLEGNSSITIKSSSVFSLTNKFKGTSINETIISPAQGDIVIWEFGLSIPKLSSGTKYLKEGSKIMIKYLIDQNAEFIETVDSTIHPTIINGNELIWIFDAPSINDQLTFEKWLFSEVFRIKIKYLELTPQFTKTTNKLIVHSIFFDDNESTGQFESLDGTVTVVSSDASEIATFGLGYPVANYGPKDNKGTISWINGNEGNQFYDDALLGFSLLFAQGPVTSYDIAPTQYEVEYLIDDNLTISQFYSGDFFYRPNSSFVAAFPGWVPLKEQPQYDLYVKYGYKDQLDEEWTLVKENVTLKKLYTASQLGLDLNKHVSEVKFVFTKSVAGMYGNRINFYTTVKEGYVGRVSNKIRNAIIVGHDFENDPFEIGTSFRAWPEAYRLYMDERYVDIIERPEGETSVVHAKTQIVNHTKNTIQLGENKVQVQITNDISSLKSVKGPFEGTLLLPRGVKLLNDQPVNLKYKVEMLDDNFEQSGCELISIKWLETHSDIYNNHIMPEQTLTAYINILVTEDAPSRLNIYFYGSISDTDFTVTTVHDEEVITDSFKILDDLDINKNGITDEYLIMTGNTYYLNKKESLEVYQQTKGSIDDRFQQTGSSYYDTEATFEIVFSEYTDEFVEDLVIIDTLPYVNDENILSSTSRGSTINLSLTGPIQLPDEWKGKVDVFYSTSSIPKVSGVIDKNTIYPENIDPIQDKDSSTDVVWQTQEEVLDFSSIKSFKLVKNSNTPLIQARNIKLSFTLKIPSSDNSVEPLSLIEQEDFAWNSFVIAINSGIPVEVMKSGIIILEDNQQLPPEEETQKPGENENKPIDPENKPIELPATGLNSIVACSFIMIMIGAGLLFYKKKLI